MTMTEDEKQRKMGVWVRESRTFYWLECGPLRVSNETERIRKILTARDVVLFSTGRHTKGSNPYSIISLSDAEQKGYLVERLFLNPHVRKNLEAPEPTSEGESGGWS